MGPIVAKATIMHCFCCNHHSAVLMFNTQIAFSFEIMTFKIDTILVSEDKWIIFFLGIFYILIKFN